jgi:flagellar M-ring protein FliF
VNGLIEFVKTLGPARIAAMGAATAILIGFFAFVIMRFSQPTMAPLFTELTLDDSGRIAKELDTQGIAYEFRGDGTTVLVPKTQVTRLRMRLAETGLPRGGSVGYEIFDKSDTLGTTSFVQNINHLRALEGELARTIGSLDRVAAARVHLVVPERQLFARDTQEPSAAIVLKLRGPLDAGQIRAIRHLSASAVKGLKPERVSIVDEGGQLLADGAGDEGNAASGLDDRHAAFEHKLKEQIESIVMSVVGPGHARVQVAAEIDYSRIQQTSDIFDPESKVVRSTQTREESALTGGNDDGVTVGNEVPGGNARGIQPAAAAPHDQSKKSEEIVNYEISRTTRTETVEAGRVKKISVAVLVDGNYAHAAGAAAEATYQPRSKEEIDRISALVRSAIGYDQKRGDQVEVVNLRFADSPGAPAIAEDAGFFSMLRFTTDDIFQGVQMLVVLILSGLVLLFVVRPLIRRIVTPDESARAIAAPAPAAQVPVEAALPGPRPQADNPAARLIEVAKIQGEVQQQSIQKVGELADRNPHETVAIIRQWIHETRA